MWQIYPTDNHNHAGIILGWVFTTMKEILDTFFSFCLSGSRERKISVWKDMTLYSKLIPLYFKLNPQYFRLIPLYFKLIPISPWMVYAQYTILESSPNVQSSPNFKCFNHLKWFCWRMIREAWSSIWSRWAKKRNTCLYFSHMKFFMCLITLLNVIFEVFF